MLSVPGNVCRGKIQGSPFLQMNGQGVFKYAVRVLEESARETVAAAGMRLSDIDWLIPHQANVRILEATARKLELPREKLIVTVDHHGNTSAASVPLALDEFVQEGEDQARRPAAPPGRGRRLYVGLFGGDAMKLAMVFPGQGSQSVGMLEAYAGLPGVEEIRRTAGEVLGAEFLKLLDEGPAEKLNLTLNTQPAMLTAGYAAYRAWRALGGAAPELVAGHSLGEYTALVAAGALGFKDCLPLVRFRAQAMQEAVPEGKGAMAAILNLDDAKVIEACAEAGGEVQAVNFNSPGQVVIAGEKDAVARAIEACKAKGAKRALPLPVSAPFHSSLMKPAAVRLQQYLQNVAVSRTQIGLVNNVDVAMVSEPDKIRDALVRQAASPVRWVETIRRMAEAGVTHIIECGPGKVLAGMTKRIAPEVQSFTLADRASLEEALKC